VRIADVIYNQVALKKNRLLYGGIMKKSCDNCGNIDKYCDMFSNCINCMYDNNLHDNWQPKPSDKDQPENIDINCPHCGVEFVTAAEGNTIIKCPACEKALGKKEKPKDQPMILKSKKGDVKIKTDKNAREGDRWVTDKDQTVERDWTKAQETLRYGIDACNKLLDKPDTSDVAVSKWYEFSDKTKHQVVMTDKCAYFDGQPIEHLQAKLDKAVDIIRTAPLKHSISLTTQKDWIKNRAKFLRDCKGE